jgi:hypothetical protein
MKDKPLPLNIILDARDDVIHTNIGRARPAKVGKVSMGADPFEQTVRAKTMDEAFRIAVEGAQWNYGHAGYTGTIAEKGSFVNAGDFEGSANEVIRAFNYAAYGWSDPNGIPEELLKLASKYIDIYNDKWGPAIGMKYDVPADENGDFLFLFFGIASS